MLIQFGNSYFLFQFMALPWHAVIAKGSYDYPTTLDGAVDGQRGAVAGMEGGER